MPAVRSPDYDEKTDEGPRPIDDRSTAAPVLEANEARQGVTHHNVRRVLAISLAGIVVAFLVVYVAFFH
jgi:hypothetical protein